MDMMLHDTILHGDALETLRTLPDECVQTCVTSPPYWGLRDYGVPGQLGLERTPDEYVARMVELFAEVRRVLRADGTCWVNLGDSYAGSWGNYAPGGIKGTQRSRNGGDRWQRKAYADTTRKPPAADVRGLKPKDLVGIPWMVAFALRADGWYLRSDIIWHKSNPMPESVTDRPTKAHEYIFLLTKRERYYYDAEAIRERLQGPPQTRPFGNKNARARLVNELTGNMRPGVNWSDNPAGRNKRSVWTVATAPFAEAHFATFPPALIEPCVLAGTSPKACEHCGAPWARVVEREKHPTRDTKAERMLASNMARLNARLTGPNGKVDTTFTRGWRPSCRCEHNTGAGHSLVLDPFMGAGTVGVVARRHSRHYLGVELNASYIEMAERRIKNERQPVLWTA